MHSVAGAAEVRLYRVQLTRGAPQPGYSERLVVWAGRGEANQLPVARGAAGGLPVTDVGAPLRAGANCRPTRTSRVDCRTTASYLEAFVFAGDRDDTVSSSVAVNVDGGKPPPQMCCMQ
jgi:hypothetical protein